MVGILETAVLGFGIIFALAVIIAIGKEIMISLERRSDKYLPDTRYSDLQKYIVQLRGQGIVREEIIKKLIVVGWKQATIEKEIDSLEAIDRYDV